MIPELQIRPVSSADLESVVQIQEAITRKKIAPDWVNLIQVYLARPKGICLVAVEQGQVIGYFFGEVKHGSFGLEHAGWIDMFGVNPKAMGRGVGRALAQAVFESFRTEGVKDIYTAVQWDSGDILAFFKEMGFKLSDFINLKVELK